MNNNYNILCELSRWKKHKLSVADRERLTNAGVIKPQSEYLKGIEKGSDNLIKKNKFKLHDKSAFSKGIATAGGGGMAVPVGKGHIFLNTDSDIIRRSRDAAQAKRHEVDELIAAKKMKKKYGKSGITQMRHGNQLVGQHTSPAVIKKELQRKLTLDNIYGRDRQSKLDVGRRGLVNIKLSKACPKNK